MVEGLLQKQGLYSRAWKVRYCVLTESGLAYSAHQGANCVYIYTHTHTHTHTYIRTYVRT